MASALSSRSHHVDSLGPLPLTVDGFLPLWQRTLAWAPTVPPFGGRLQPITRWLRDAGRRIAEDDARARLARVIAWGDADVVVCPTVSCLPPKVGSWKHDDPARAFASAIPMAIFTAGFNASGQPAMNIPVRVDGVAGPVGVQVIARRGDDARLIALARQLEEALGGFDHRPPTEP